MEGIIVGVDESPYASAALRWAVEQAALTDEPVTAVMAWGYLDQHHPEPGQPFDSAYSEAVAAKVLDELVARAVGERDDLRRHVVCDLPGRALLDGAEGASLLVVGARGMGGFRGLLLGSVSRQVLHGATCPVAVVRDGAARPDGAIVVGVDGSAPSRRALQWAASHARRSRRRLVVVHAWYLPASATFFGPWPDAGLLESDAERLLADELAAVDTAGLAVERRTLADRPAGALVEASSLAALVVVGSRGHGQLAATVLGSVSDQVSHHATSPVVVVP